jgi:RimJ/RimL family protein N-acetyltransferase
MNAYILHPYGMSLLTGDGKNIEYLNWLTGYMLNTNMERNRDEWMQVFSDKWNGLIEKKIGNQLIPAKMNHSLNHSDFVEVNTRVNFKFNENRYKNAQYYRINENISIHRLEKETTSSVHGSVIPLNFWNNEDEFLKKGLGFSVFVNGEQASTAYSAFVHGSFLEIGIETIEKYRGFGYAKLACRALIDYCVANNYKPIWSCRLENIGSYKLALSLGFEPTCEIPYYRLCKRKKT